MNTSEIVITNDMISLYEKQYSREEVAEELGISVRTLSRLLQFAAKHISDLACYLDKYECLNRKKLESHHIEYLREVNDLLKTFSRDRVIQILTRKYN